MRGGCRRGFQRSSTVKNTFRQTKEEEIKYNTPRNERMKKKGGHHHHLVQSQICILYTGRFTPTSLSLLSLFELSFSSADESRLKKRKEHFRLTAMGPTSHRPAAIGYALSPKKTFPKKYKNIKKKPVDAEREVNNNSISTENSSIYHAHTPARRPACVSLQVFFQKIKRWKILI